MYKQSVLLCFVFTPPPPWLLSFRVDKSFDCVAVVLIAHAVARAVRDPGGTQDGVRVDRVLPNRGAQEAGPGVGRFLRQAAGLLLPAQQARDEEELYDVGLAESRGAGRGGERVHTLFVFCA